MTEKPRAEIRVSNLTKTFTLAEEGGLPPTLGEALRLGRRETRKRVVKALADVSFTVREGERLGIIGRNGAGKTTLLSTIAGLASASEGRVEVDGHVHAILTIGTVLRDDLTGRENIALDAAVHGRAERLDDKLCDEIIAFADIGEFIDRPVRTYSSGMKARLAFSMAAFIEPDVLIIDETLSVGDVFFGAKAARRMRAVAATGRIVVLVSHQLQSIVDMCSRCIWLDDGRIVMDGEPKTVTAAYEAAIRDADESELRRKFGTDGAMSAEGAAIVIEAVEMLQAGTARQATAAAMVPLAIRIAGRRDGTSPAGDLELSLLRVDGRLVWRRRLSEEGLALPAAGSFALRVDLDPLLLGADLYRLDVTAIAGERAVHRLVRVVEIVDESGQHGGKPLLFHPPRITARPLAVEEVS